MFSISGMVHLRSKALERTILKICEGGEQQPTEWEKWTGYLLHVDAVTRAAEDETGLHRLGESFCLRHCQPQSHVLVGDICDMPGLRFPLAPLAGSLQNDRTLCRPGMVWRSC